jgi:hypothetical protein
MIVENGTAGWKAGCMLLWIVGCALAAWWLWPESIQWF